MIDAATDQARKSPKGDPRRKTARGGGSLRAGIGGPGGVAMHDTPNFSLSASVTSDLCKPLTPIPMQRNPPRPIMEH